MHHQQQSITVTWSISDVQFICHYLSDEQAFEVLQYVKDNHDPDVGINFGVIDTTIDKLYPFISLSYVDSVLQGTPADYQAVQIVQDLKQRENTGNRYLPYFSVLLVHKNGNLYECAEFTLRDEALTLACQLCDAHNFVFIDFTSEEMRVYKKLGHHHPNEFLKINQEFIDACVDTLQGTIFSISSDYVERSGFINLHRAALDDQVKKFDIHITSKQDLKIFIFTAKISEMKSGKIFTYLFLPHQ